VSAWARRHPWRAGFTLLALAGASSILLVLATLPRVRSLSTGWPERTAYMEAWLRSDTSGSARLEYRPVRLSRIPRSVQRAVLVSEDAAFFSHGGFDWFEVREAVREAWEEREFPRGASTISQQLARNLFLSPARTPFRKLREALIARRLEAALSKPRILELYLNVIEFGRGVYGVDAASRRYFGVGVENVGRREAAALAATIPSPRRNNPASGTASFRRRADLAYRRAFENESEQIEPRAEDVPPPPERVDSVAPPELDSAFRASPDSSAAPARDTAPSRGGGRAQAAGTLSSTPPISKNGSHFSRGDGRVARLTRISSVIEINTPGITM
jgi:monofunctional biosynthetic peptidoglycan transglycosylase